jgi:hypothetical protein
MIPEEKRLIGALFGYLFKVMLGYTIRASPNGCSLWSNTRILKPIAIAILRIAMVTPSI